MRKNLLIGPWLEQLRQYRSVALDTNLIIYALEGVEPYDEMALHLFRLMEREYFRGLHPLLSRLRPWSSPFATGTGLP